MIALSSRGIYETEAKNWQTSWEAMVTWLEQCAKSLEPNQKQIPLFSFCTFQGGIGKEHAQAVSAVMLDYDGTDEAHFHAIVRAAQAFRGFGYTTYNHVLKGAPPCRFRIGLALDRACHPDNWDLVWHRVGHLLGIVSDKAPDRKTRDPGRFFFLPAQNPNGPPVWFAQWGGPLLSLDSLLAPSADGGALMPAMIESELEQSERVSLFDLQQLGQKLLRHKAADFQMLGRATLAGLRGEVFAADGYRNDVAFKLAGELAKQYPKADAADLAERFRAALDLQGEPSIETFTSQIQRHQLKHQQQEREKRALRQMQAQLTGSEQIAPGEQAASGVIAGLPLMVQKDGFYWCREPNSKDYNEVYSARDIRVALHRKYHGVIDLYGADGKAISLDNLLLTYSRVVRKVEANYLIQENEFDARPESASLTLATAPRRQLQATFHTDVDKWLRLLGGTCYPDIEAWIQGVFHLDRASPSLYLWGQSGCGKTLLAYGVGQLWENPLTRFEVVIDSFNSSLSRNPLVLADEGFPNETKFTWLRSFLSEGSRQVNEKYRPQYTLLGHVRLIVTANNPAAFEFGRKYLTAQDAQAIGERVIQIPVRKEACAYLESLGDVTHWVHQNKIAEHALWLSQQPHETKRGRWAVTAQHSDKNAFESSLVDIRYSWFVAWLSDYLNTPRRLEQRYTYGNPDSWLVRTDNGRLLVAVDAYRYIDKCESSEFKHALRFFAKGVCQLRVPWNPSRIIGYKHIDLNRFWNSAQEHIDLETLLATVAQDSKERVNVK